MRQFSKSSHAIALGAMTVAFAIIPALHVQARTVQSAAMPARPGSDAVPRPPAGAVRIGELAPGRVMHLRVTLRLPRPAAVSAFIAAVSDRSSPLFHHFLRPGQFGPRFGPSIAEVHRVQAALRAAGLIPGRAAANRLSIPVTAPASAVERAFGIGLVRYRLPGGRVAFASTAAPDLPTAIAPNISGVLGLQDLYQPRALAGRARRAQPGRRGGATGRMRKLSSAAGPQPCSAARSAASNAGAYTANQLAAQYAMTPLYAMGDLGGGVRIGLVEFEPNLTSDISAYKSCYGISTSVSYHQVDGGAGTGAGAGEAAADIENVIGLAPGASVDVYQAPNSSDQDSYDAYDAVIEADSDQVVSTSWGQCELDGDQSLFTSEQPVFAQAATQGQTVFAATSVTGSTACFQDSGTTHGTSLAVTDPASQQYVIAVGGTSIGSNGTEKVWNNSSSSDGAGGGGLSADWCMASYQYQTSIPGLIGPDSAKGSCSTIPYERQVPDVSADADPNSGYVIDYSGSWFGGDGGTGAATPLWAAVAALIDDSPFCAAYGSGDPGVLAEGLYAVVNLDYQYIYPPDQEALYDVTSGNNDYTPSGYSGGLYPATSGYDMASGLGTPIVGGLTGNGQASSYYPGLAALMCDAYRTKLDTYSVTSVSPSSGPSGQKVTVNGTGFLPIAGAELAQVGSHVVQANCTSTTHCTVVLPKLGSGTVGIEISVEDFGFTSPVNYRVVNRQPKISSLSPKSGPTSGGYTVTIHGANLSGLQSVRFGSKLASKLRVISSREVSVRVPAGRGRVLVTLTTTGGKATSHFLYRKVSRL